MAKRVSVEDRFLAKVDQCGDCWSWTALTSNGYGLFWLEGRMAKAHRVAYCLFVGPIPADLELDHLCHTRDLSCAGGEGCLHRRCVRPDHLEPVTHLVNVQRGRNFVGRSAPRTSDGPLKGTSSSRKNVTREAVAGNAAKTHCPQKHKYTPENTYIDPRGRRMCRICRAAAKKSAHPRSEALPRLCLGALESIGRDATSTQVLRWLQANGKQARLAPVTTTLGRLADREQPLVKVIRQGVPGGNCDPSVWEITAAGRLLLAA